MAEPPSSKAEKLAQYFIEKRPEGSTKSSPSLLAQIEHRIKLVSFWAIAPGSRVLEIGCGQGDCTVALADAVGEHGHVDAVDPGAPDYGAPFTLSQAQSHITNSALGPRIAFHCTTPTSYIESYTGAPYDYIVLSHSIYYFSNPSILPDLLSSLSSLPAYNTHLCIAEWSLHSRSQSSSPHVLTALLCSLLESKQTVESSGNIRTVLSPEQISRAAQKSGWGMERESVVETGEGMQDAYWEVRDLIRKRHGEGGLLAGLDGLGDAERTVIEAMGDAVVGAVGGVDGGLSGMRCMDVWIGRFVR
ncbi:uncharacterized protein BP5553_03728 [Venustampulla echinocandica]|uniref:Methyltransferase domain-containing protein n=1 Tax=Venustampulla echinocandica TaxID=2656787 RepID=A0A370TV90_9HELO|nr:uncharacterized protein BP5553_03728 [Venustampulla echinocandica]RDL39388.1 hypothetical protein BP5553_03728 [Venustampulla echinocandica]